MLLQLADRQHARHKDAAPIILYHVMQMYILEPLELAIIFHIA